MFSFFTGYKDGAELLMIFLKIMSPPFQGYIASNFRLLQRKYYGY